MLNQAEAFRYKGYQSTEESSGSSCHGDSDSNS